MELVKRTLVEAVLAEKAETVAQVGRAVTVVMAGLLFWRALPKLFRQCAI